ncbi:hypothetical protein CASFOL_033241 [Castilleja foliolosa]|uniref:Cyclin N-terminal domain-containing protein n=1 Tax=Castilleja foliolosa TaxID=1961234 RepID=A0ABD3BZM8_9LAMI
MELNGHRRARRKNIVAYQNGELNTSSSSDDDYDPWTAWAYKPQTITLFLIGAYGKMGHVILNALMKLILLNCEDTEEGSWAMIDVFLAYCLLQAPSTFDALVAALQLSEGGEETQLKRIAELQAENDAIGHELNKSNWKMQKCDDARQFMKFMHPDLGVELPERSYGSDCRIFVPEDPTRRNGDVMDKVMWLIDWLVQVHGKSEISPETLYLTINIVDRYLASKTTSSFLFLFKK